MRPGWKCKTCLDVFSWPRVVHTGELAGKQSCPYCGSLDIYRRKPFVHYDPPKGPKRSGARASKLIPRLAERDGWICHLCGEPIDSQLPYSGPEARHGHRATLDHLLPHSLGGRTRLENLRLAHAKCNSRRGNRLLEAA